VASDRRLILLLCITMLTNAVSMGAFPPLLPEMSSAGRLADWQLGIVAGAFGLARTVADIPVGLFVAHNLHRGLLLAPVGLITGALCLASGGPFLVLVLGRALMGAGHAIAIVAGLTAILRYRAHRHLAASLNAYEFSAIVGMLGGVMLVGALPAWFGWNLAYLVACAPLSIGLALVPGMLRGLSALDAVPATAPAARNPGRVNAVGDPRSAASDGNPADGATMRDPATAVPPRSITFPAVLAFVAGATVAVSYSTLEQFVIPLRGSREFGLDRAGVAGLLSIAQFCDLLCLLPVGALADRYRAPRVLGPALLVLAAAVTAITFGGFTLVLGGCVLFGLSMAGWMLPLSVLRQETPAELVAWRTAIYRVGVDGGLFLGPFLSGLLGEQRVGLLAACLAPVLVSAALLLLREQARPLSIAPGPGRGPWCP
jgi:MFS family permease